jgi:F-box and WD-40 domain protein 1/11
MANNAAFPMPSYLQAFRQGSAMNANRFDEGYSEDTRSQSGSDMIMRTDSRLGDEGMEQELQYALPDEVMQMSESERSGMSGHAWHEP